MHEPGAVDFYQLLADLRGTEDFIFHRGDLAVRAWSVIENCAANTGCANACSSWLVIRAPAATVWR
jgi:hypothetical protein